MNNERLLEYYDRVADAPDATSCFRRFVLDLAVRGKLVSQDPGDEPASKRLKRIAVEREQLLRAGVAKALGLELPDLETSTDLPKAWRLSSLGRLLMFSKNGLNLKADKSNGKYKITRIETISLERIDMSRVGFASDLSDALVEQHQIKRGDILFSHINSEPHLGKTAICIQDDATLIHGVNLLLLRSMPGVDPHYLNLVLRQLRASGYFISISQRAVNQSSINQKNLAKTIIPFPPLSEQHRIVIKVDELMQLCDRLEAKRAGGGAQSASGGEPCPPQRTGP